MTTVHSYIKCISTKFLGSILCISLSAQAEDIDDIFNLSLEDLSNITVSVSNKREENLGDVPGNVTVYTANDLDRLGYYTLEELANITPGYSTQSALENTLFETRGNADSLNSKHLLLLDGIPINHARDYMAFSQQQLPLQAAEKVEFLRGPASALYGVSAFHGVINIQTKEAKNLGAKSESHVAVGNYNQKSFHGYTAKNASDSRFRMSASYYQKGASLAEIPVENPSRNVLRDQQESLYFNSRYSINSGIAKGTSFGIIYMSKETGYGESWTGGQDTSEVNREERKIFIPYLRYENAYSDILKLSGYVKYNESIETGTQSNDIWLDPFLFKFNIVTKNIEYQLETDWDVSKGSSLIVGANIDARWQVEKESYIYDNGSDPTKINPFFDSRSTTTSFYSQYSQNLSKLSSGLSLTLGIRYDKGVVEDNEYTQVSPRVSIVQELSDNWHAKFLFGTALKAPGVKEVGHNIEKSSGLIDPGAIQNINAETIGMFELTMLYISHNHYTSLTYFESETDDAIIQTPVDDSLKIDQNSEFDIFSNSENEITSTGFELESRYKYLDAIWVMGNITHTETNATGESENVDIPKNKLNLSISYDLDPYMITLTSRYVSSYSSTEGTKEYDGQTISDFNTQYKINNNYWLALSIKNVFDEAYFQSNNGSDGIPKDRRIYLLNFRSQF